MKNYRGLVFRYLKREKKSTIPIFISIVLTITMLTSVVFISQNIIKNSFEKEKLRYGDYDVRIENLDREKLEKFKNSDNVKDFALAKDSGILNFIGKIYGATDVLSVDTYAVDPKIFNEYMAFKTLEGRLPESENEIVVSKGYLKYLGEDVKVGTTINFEKRDISGKKLEDYSAEISAIYSELYPETGYHETDWVAFDKKVQEEIEKRIGKLEKEKKVYTLVGILDISEDDPIWGKNVIRLLTEEELTNTTGTFESFTYLKDSSKQEELANEIGLKYIKPTAMMSPYGFPGSDFKYPGYKKESYSTVLSNGIARNILILSIVFSFMALYNTFHASVAKRIKYYGIIRAIGGSMKQIAYLIFSEALVLYVMAVPIGLILGFGLVKLEGYILGDILGLLRGFETNINAEAIMLTLLGTLVIVLASVFSAFRKEGKLTPIEAIINARGLGNAKVKIKNIMGQSINTTDEGKVDDEATREILEYEKNTFIYKIMKKLFRFEGELAGKNISRDAKIHNLTKGTLFIAMCVLIFFFLQVINGVIQVNELTTNSYWDTKITPNTALIKGEQLDEIRNIEGVESAYLVNNKDISIVLKEEDINSELMKVIKNRPEIKLDDSNDKFAIKGRIATLDDESIKLYPNLNKEELDNGGVVLVDKGNSFYIVALGEDALVPVWGRSNPVLNYKVGDTLKASVDLSILNTEELKKFNENNKEYLDLKVVGTVEDDLLNSIYNSINQNDVDRDVTLFTTEEGLKKIFSEFSGNEILIKTTNSQSRKDTIKELESFIGRNDYELTDNIGLQLDMVRNIKEKLGLNIIFAITMIVMVILNLINTMNASIMAREKELAGMRAIGMSPSQQRKMVIAEIFNISLIAAFFTIITAGVLTFTSQGQNITTGKISPVILVLGDLLIIVVLMLIANITSIAPLAKVKKFSIVESLKNE